MCDLQVEGYAFCPKKSGKESKRRFQKSEENLSCLCELCPPGTGSLCCKRRRWPRIVPEAPCFSVTAEFEGSVINRHSLTSAIVERGGNYDNLEAE